MTNLSQIPSIWTVFTKWLLLSLPAVISALCIIVIGLPLARYLKKKCIKKIPAGADPTSKRFLINLIYILAVIFIVISALITLGVATTSLLTLLGAASLAIGFALKDFLSNIAAGFVLIFLRPFKVGDQISVQNMTGIVTEIHLFVTLLNTPDNEALFIPNNQVVSNYIINFTYNAVRRLDVSIGIDYDTDIKTVREILLREMNAHEQVQIDPAPIVLVQNLGDSAMQLIARLWVNKDYYTQIKSDLLEQFKISLDAVNIHIPSPQLTLHVSNSKDYDGKK